MIKTYLHCAVAAAFFLASGAGNTAFAQTESPVDNDSVNSAQHLMIPSERRVVVTGALGVITAAETVVGDVDFYSFFGQRGDKVTIDIDYGVKARPVNPTDPRSLDSVLVLYRPDLTIRHQIDDLPLGVIVDPESMNRFDPRMDSVELDATGIHIVGVTSSGRTFLDGGQTTPFVSRTMANGSYTLVIEGASPSAIQISIDIRPGKKTAKIDPKSKGKIAVALLSSQDFDARKVDRDSVRFGPTGKEASGRCGKDVEFDKHDDDDDDNDHRSHGKRTGFTDVDRDGDLDLICRFEIRAARFEVNDTGEVIDTGGMVTGMVDGMPFEGRGSLKVLPAKKKRHHDDD